MKYLIVMMCLTASLAQAAEQPDAKPLGCGELVSQALGVGLMGLLFGADGVKYASNRYNRSGEYAVAKSNCEIARAMNEDTKSAWAQDQY